MRRYLDRQLKLRQLRAVLAIATHGSLLKAAQKLGASQPALTKTLHEAETMIGARLFDRHARGVRATPAGEAVAESARRILDELGHLDADLDRIAGRAADTLDFGALPVAAGGVLPGALAHLKRARPDLVVRMTQGVTEDLLPALAAGDLDVVVGRLYDPAAPDGLIRERLYEEPIAIVARAHHPIFAAAPPRVEDVRRYELVLPTIGQRIGQELEHLMLTLDLPCVATLRSSSAYFIREMLHATDLLSIMPALMMAGDILRGAIRVVPLPQMRGLPPRPAGLILRPGRRLPPPAQALVTSLRAYLAEIEIIGLAGITGGDSSSPRGDGTQASAPG